jgi:GT2 family glycosyltransferase
MSDSFGLEDITVSITTLRRAHELDKTLCSIGALPNIQVILNGAKQRDYRWVVDKYQGRVRFLRNPKNIGVAATFNQGMVTADTRYVVLSGDDLEYSKGWAETLLDVLNGPHPPLQVSLSEPVAFSAFCVDKKLVALQGWFDHNFMRIYYEDEDWCLRVLERSGRGQTPVSAQSVVPRLGVVRRPKHRSAPWNSIPNRFRFWRKWERISSPAEDSLYLRPNIIVRRRLEEPRWPYLESVRMSYQAGDYTARPFIYDKPGPAIRLLASTTTNPLFIGLRKLVQRLTNPEQELRPPII